jgi:hypothetical protein
MEGVYYLLYHVHLYKLKFIPFTLHIKLVFRSEENYSPEWSEDKKSVYIGTVHDIICSQKICFPKLKSGHKNKKYLKPQTCYEGLIINKWSLQRY